MNVRPMLEAPARIQRQRRKGWRIPPAAICVDRTTVWGNPFRVQKDEKKWLVGDGCVCVTCETRAEAHAKAVELYRRVLIGPHPARSTRYASVPSVQDVWKHLRGADLVCWCPYDLPCHADVLLEVANAPSPYTFDNHTLLSRAAASERQLPRDPLADDPANGDENVPGAEKPLTSP